MILETLDAIDKNMSCVQYRQEVDMSIAQEAMYNKYCYMYFDAHAFD